MKIIAFFAIILCFYGCPPNATKTNPSSPIETSYCIFNTSVGEITMTTPISSIGTLLREGYHMMEETYNPDGDDINSNISYVIHQGDNLIMRIIPDEDYSERIYSIIVYDSKYKIFDTGIHVGDNIRKIKTHYTVDDVYFNIADGLYLSVNSFNGAFLVDLEGNGDKYESLETLDDGLKIKAIIIINTAGQ